jgi:hypothetical protein
MSSDTTPILATSRQCVYSERVALDRLFQIIRPMLTIDGGIVAASSEGYGMMALLNNPEARQHCVTALAA